MLNYSVKEKTLKSRKTKLQRKITHKQKMMIIKKMTLIKTRTAKTQAIKKEMGRDSSTLIFLIRETNL
jgi:hypothetical protein